MTSGEIIINGINLQDYSRRDLARVMSFTFQTSPVLPVSIKEYVSLGAPDRPDDDLVVRALQASAADAVVDQLEDGWLSYGGGAAGATLSSADWQLPQLVPRPPGVPMLEMLDMDGSGMEASISSEGTLVDGEKEENRPRKRLVQPKLTSLPTTVNGEEATIHFPDHSPEPCVLSGGQVSPVSAPRSTQKLTCCIIVATDCPRSEPLLHRQRSARVGRACCITRSHRRSFAVRTNPLAPRTGEPCTCPSHSPTADSVYPTGDRSLHYSSLQHLRPSGRCLALRRRRVGRAGHSRRAHETR